MVTREELRAELWPDDTYVDFDRSLNTAANKLREALGDSASRPKLVETLPRRGYRFLGQVESPETPPTHTTQTAAAVMPAAGVEGHVHSKRVDRPTVGDSAAPSLGRPTVQRNILAGALATVLVAVAILWPNNNTEGRSRVVRFSPAVPPGAGEPAISPDGRRIAWIQGRFWTSSKLWIRDLDQEEPQELAGTEGAYEIFWSPDSDAIGFATRQHLKKVPVNGGAVVPLIEVPNQPYRGGVGGAWSPDGDSIVFNRLIEGTVYEVSARGGSPTLLTALEEAQGRGWYGHPHFLPVKERRLLLLRVNRLDPKIVLRDLSTGRETFLVEGSRPVYSSTGHILYQADENGGPIWALPFSIDEAEVTGEPFPIASNAEAPTVASDGTLLYLQPGREGGYQLGWRGRDGSQLGVCPTEKASKEWNVLHGRAKLEAWGPTTGLMSLISRFYFRRRRGTGCRGTTWPISSPIHSINSI